MYETEDSSAILARHGVTGMADVNALILNFQNPRSLPTNAVLQLNELQFPHELGTTGTNDQATDPQLFPSDLD